MDVQNTDSGARPESMLERTVSADMAAMPDLVAFLEGALETMGCPLAITTKLMVCLDEIASNVMKFSGAHDLTVRLERGAPEGTWRLSFIDDGTPWNPLTHADPDITLSAEERPIGGLGLLMVKKMMDDVCYSRDGETNVLRLRIAQKG
jgi:sigma-B regulation protein RsbU (phosphoserine phosphatase)